MSLSLRVNTRMRPVPQARAPGSPEPGGARGRRVAPPLQTSGGAPVRPRPGGPEAHRAAVQTFLKPYGLSVLRAHGNLGSPGASVGWLSIQSQAKAGVSSSPATTPLVVPVPMPRSRAGVRECPCVRDTFPFSGVGAEPLLSAPARGSPPPAQRFPCAPCPLCQGEKAAEPETKKLLPPSTLGPCTRPRHSPAPSLDPSDTALEHAGEGGRVGESASQRGLAGAAHAPRPGTPPRQPRPHRPGPLALPPPTQPSPHLSSGATEGRGAHKEGVYVGGGQSTPGKEGSRQGSWHGPGSSYLPDFFFDLRDVCEDEEDHEQRERGQHPAPELQLHGGFAPAGTRAGRREEQGLEGAAAGAGASARHAQRADTLRSERVPAGGGSGSSSSSSGDR